MKIALSMLFSVCLLSVSAAQTQPVVSMDEAYRRLAAKQAGATTQPDPEKLQKRIKELEAQVATLQQQLSTLTAQLNGQATSPGSPGAKHFVPPPDGQWPTAETMVGVPLAEIKKWSNMVKLVSAGDGGGQIYELHLWKKTNGQQQDTSYTMTVENGIVKHVDVQ